MRGLTTLAPEPTFVNTDAHTVRCPFVSLREAGAAMDVSFLGGPRPQRGIGVVAPFDFALDRELWRWVPDDVSLHLTRTPFVPVEVSLDLARLVSEHETLGDAVRALNAVAPEVVAYACTSGSFVGGVAVTAGSPLRMNAGWEWPGCSASVGRSGDASGRCARGLPPGRRDVMSVELT